MADLADAIAALERAVARLEETAASAPDADAAAAERQRTAEIAHELTSRVDAALTRIEKLLAEGG